MELDIEIQKLSELYDHRLEELVPQQLPPASRLMMKREGRTPLLLRAGRLGMAWTVLIVIFAYLSLVAVRSMGNKNPEPLLPVLNASVFSADHPGSVVSAFREVTE